MNQRSTWDSIVNQFGSLDRIAEPEALPGWLATTVRRECLQLIRRTGRQRVVRNHEPVDTPDPGPPVDHVLLEQVLPSCDSGAVQPVGADELLGRTAALLLLLGSAGTAWSFVALGAA